MKFRRMRWADLGQRMASTASAFSTMIKFGYDAAGNVLRLTLLRSPKWPDPDADMGHQHFHYALYPHAGTWKDAMTVRHGFEYDYPLRPSLRARMLGPLPAEHSFASVTPDNVVLTAVKKAEDTKADLPRVRVGRQGVHGGVSCATGRDGRDRDQPDGAA